MVKTTNCFSLWEVRTACQCCFLETWPTRLSLGLHKIYKCWRICAFCFAIAHWGLGAVGAFFLLWHVIWDLVCVWILCRNWIPDGPLFPVVILDFDYSKTSIHTENVYFPWPGSNHMQRGNAIEGKDVIHDQRQVLDHPGTWTAVLPKLSHWQSGFSCWCWPLSDGQIHCH